MKKDTSKSKSNNLKKVDKKDLKEAKGGVGWCPYPYPQPPPPKKKAT